MKILVISDTHKKIERVIDIENKHGGFDAIFHLGDHASDAAKIADRLQEYSVNEDADEVKSDFSSANSDIHPIFAVRGNCDGAITKEECTRIVEVDGFRFMLTHGHPFGVNYDFTNLYYAAKEADADMVIFGHTHRCMLDESGDVIILNPGSISNPRDASNGTYAVINTDSGRLECVTFEYDGREGETKKRRNKYQGGYLRRIFNDSDGQ